MRVGAFMRRVLSFLLGLLLAISGAVGALAALIGGAGTSPGLMLALMRRDAPSTATGLPEEDYPAVAAMITGYLAGSISAFQYTLVDETGAETACFNQKEQQHMADCRALFTLCREVLLAATAAAALAMLALCLTHRARAAAAGFLTGGGLVLALLAALAVWGMADFDGLFVLFHRLSFANDLWLLNPGEDLLIRLMPTAFFLHYAALIGITWLLLALLGETLAAVLFHRAKRPAHS